MAKIHKLFFNPVNILLWSLTIAMIVFVFSIVQTYTHLKYESPLANFKGGIKTPIYLEIDKKIEAYGTFDRDISCNLISFTLLLKNKVTGDVYLLDKNHLIDIPIRNRYPGKDLKVNFSVSIPSSIKSGIYNPTFNGDYFCKEGLFSDLKHVQIQVAPITVVGK